VRDLIGAQPTQALAPIAIINATGAWVDETLRRLALPSRRLIGGTKGSHLLSTHPGLRGVLAGRGVYAEATDGRPVFIIPLADLTLVGTTDEPFTDLPQQAVAREDELEYLISAVRSIFPQLDFGREDVDFHYSGVRPLPYVDAARPAAITRRHWLEQIDASLPTYCVIGGKLTTCRSLAEETAALVLNDLTLPILANSRERIVPGAEEYPTDLASSQDSLAARFSLPVGVVRNVWRLLGSRTERALNDIAPELSLLPGVELPERLADWMIEHESARTLDDLVERRLMLLYDQRLSLQTLKSLAEALVRRGCLREEQIPSAIEATVERLRSHFGKTLSNS
jgi:glycerol-3-phosphate dehydrogenase